MEAHSIQEYIVTMADLFQAISSKPINIVILDNAKKKYPILKELIVPPTNLFDNNEQFYRFVLDEMIYTIEYEILQKNFTSLIAVHGDIIILIDTIKIIANHPKYYEPKEMRFYFSTFRDMVCQKLQYNEFMRCMIVHVYFIGKIDFQNLFTSIINREFYSRLRDFIKARIMWEHGKVYKTYAKEQKTLEEKLLLIEDKLRKIEQYYDNKQFENLWSFYKNNYITEEEQELVFNNITYNDPYLFEILELHDDFGDDFIGSCKIQIANSFRFMNPYNNFSNVINQTLSRDFVRDLFAKIMKTKPLYNFYTNKDLVNETTTKNYRGFIQFINLNNNTIPTSAIDSYIIPVIMKKGIHGMTNNYQRIAINSYYKCFQIRNYISNVSTEKGYGDFSVEETLFIGSLIMIILHESNHFLRRYNTNPKTSNEVKTPRNEEGGREFYRQIFGNPDILELTLAQAKAILVEEKWDRNELLSIFEKKNSTNEPSMLFMKTTQSNCYRGQ